MRPSTPRLGPSLLRPPTDHLPLLPLAHPFERRSPPPLPFGAIQYTPRPSPLHSRSTSSSSDSGLALASQPRLPRAPVRFWRAVKVSSASHPRIPASRAANPGPLQTLLHHSFWLQWVVLLVTALLVITLWLQLAELRHPSTKAAQPAAVQQVVRAVTSSQALTALKWPVDDQLDWPSVEWEEWARGGLKVEESVASASATAEALAASSSRVQTGEARQSAATEAGSQS